MSVVTVIQWADSIDDATAKKLQQTVKEEFSKIE